MKKPILYLHIGTPKTGTTFVQETFGRRRDELLRHGILYPHAGIFGSGHASFAVEFVSDEYRAEQNASNILDTSSTPENIRDDILYEMGVAGRAINSVIVSAEVLAHATQSNINKLNNLFFDYFDIEVVLFLRRQDMAAESLRAQNYKVNYADFLVNELLFINNADYSWNTVFVKSKLNIYEYADGASSTTLPERIIKAFNLPKSFVLKNSQLNKKLGRDLLEYIHFYTHLIYDTGHYFECLEHLQKVEQENPSNDLYRYFYSPETHKEIMALHKEGNQMIEKQYGCKLFRDPQTRVPDFAWKPYPGLPKEKKELFDEVLKQYYPDANIINEPIDRGYEI